MLNTDSTPSKAQTISAPLANRGLRSAGELGMQREHGERIRYMAGCRCDACRRANTQYETNRAAARKAGDWNGIVPAAKAREHLASLSAQFVGRRTVGDITSIADSVLTEIIAGRKKNIRARTERLILAVTVAGAADGALIPAGPTWVMVDELIGDGHSKASIARQLGYQTPALQLKREAVTVRNAYEVKCLYEKLRSCNAKPSLKLLAELREEGFRMPQIEKRVAALAKAANQDVPNLTVRKGRINVHAARFVQLVHVQLTE